MNKLTLALFLVVHQLFSQDIDQGRLDRYFDVLDSSGRFMGSISVIRDGKAIYEKSVGFSNVELSSLSGRETLYRVGSISKTFTSVLIMKSVEKGLLSLEDTIGRWYPQIKESGKITIRHLLMHRSGIHNFTDNPGYLQWNTRAVSAKGLLDTIAAQRLDFPPGSRYAYSNSGYVLLTFILEKAWNQQYEDLIRKWILKPGRLQKTFYAPPFDTLLHAHSYRWLFGKWRRQSFTDPSVP